MTKGRAAEPLSTYRLQLRPGFTLLDAADLVPYLHDLGVDAVYTSPVLEAMPGSQHGYDVADPTRISEALGGEQGFRELADAVRRNGMRLVVDVVPNHLGISDPAANPAWWDLLRHGPQSRYAPWFDITGWPLRVPVLADDPAALDDLTIDDDALRYHEHSFPLAPGTGSGPARDVHEAQHYRLVAWNADLGYRRFFAINELAAVRVEDPDVFDQTHAAVLRLVGTGAVAGLRIDHPDGLADPAGYLERLRAAAPSAWIVVEKILEPGETLPDWPAHGSTGYDALAEVDAVLRDPAAGAALDRLDASLTGSRTDWPTLVHECKLDVSTDMLGSELRRLARLARDVIGAADALAEVLAAFPVYRSYLRPGDDTGIEHLDQAVATARARRPDLAAALGVLDSRLRDPHDELAVRFQQTSGAVMAKAVEDTAYYRWTRFVAANEVGGDPAHLGHGIEGWHAAQARREALAPASMTTLSTHDTKRSGDVRARLAVLTEIPDRWAAAVASFDQLAARAGAPVADPALGHLLWQTLVGAWPLPAGRLHDYLTKAMREARTRTEWTRPDADFEATMHATADAALTDPALRSAVDELVGAIAAPGWSNALSATLLQLTMPGVPDTYQGTELWDLSLVDPDNRRPVDFGPRRELLARIDAGWTPPVDDTGAAKLHLLSRVLRTRRDRPELFTGYRPIDVHDHAVSFERSGAIAVATRLPVGLGAVGWDAAVLPLPSGTWGDVLSGAAHTGSVALETLLVDRPATLLVRTR